MFLEQGRAFRFDSFLLDESEHRLSREGQPIALRPKAFETLLHLVKHSPRLVTKDQLLEELWPDIVVGEGVLTHCIWEIREALGDDPKQPRWIETVPKLGYKFLSEVEIVVSGPAPEPPGWKRLWLARVLALLLLAPTVVLLRRDTPVIHHPIPEITYLSSKVGLEMSPDLSPDGHRFAFAWNGPDGSNFDIYVQCVGCSNHGRITDHPFLDLSPAWSPDGKHLAFIRWQEGSESGSVMLIDPVGGGDRVLGSIRADPEFDPGSFATGRSWVHLDWATNGSAVLFEDRLDGCRHALFRLDLETLERTQLTHPPAGYLGDSYPSVSPDGRSLAFVRMKDFWTGDLFQIELDEGLHGIAEPERLTLEESFLTHPSWEKNGESLVFSTGDFFGASLQSTSKQFWPSGSWVVFGITEGLVEPSFGNGKLAFVSVRSGRNLYIEEIETASVTSAPRRLTHSSKRDFWARFSPDGDTVAFVSNRSGNYEIWTKSTSGDDLAQLTELHGQVVAPPVWSPDGDRLAFGFSQRGGSVRVFDVHRRCTWILEVTPLPNGLLSWSLDGSRLYAPALVDGRAEAVVQDLSGNRHIQRLHLPGVLQVIEAPDSSLVFVRNGSLIRRYPESEESVLEGVDTILRHSNSGAFLRSCQGSLCQIHFLDWETGTVQIVSTVPFRDRLNLDISPDGRFLLYSQTETLESDLLLLDYGMNG